MIGDRMRQARLAAGLTLAEVAERLGNAGQPITRQGISKYEHNRSTPKASFLLRLAQALGVKSSYFLEEPDLRVEWLAFRKDATLTPTRQAQIRAHAKNVAEGQYDLWLTLYPNEKPQFPHIEPIRTFDDAEAAAVQLREAWGLGDAPIESVTQSIEDHGGVVVSWPHDEGQFDGLAAWMNHSVPLIISSTAVSPDRRRFNLAHEMEHLLSHREGPVSAEEEPLAHRFAGAFLVPVEVARRELGDRRRHLNFEELGLLKCKYGLSMQAWVHRARDLDIIDDGLYNMLSAEFVSRNLKKREPAQWACEAPEEPLRLKQMVLRAFAEGVITEEHALQLCPGCLTPQPLARPEGRKYTAVELMKLPREERNRILAEAAAAAEEEYRTNPELTEFEAFGEDDLYDEYPE